MIFKIKTKQNKKINIKIIKKLKNIKYKYNKDISKIYNILPINKKSHNVIFVSLSINTICLKKILYF